MLILGIDPGLRNTGFGIIQVIENKPVYITSGTITTLAHEALAKRLKCILNGIQQIITENKPQIVSIEKVFVNNNPHSTLQLGQARGAAIAACVLSDLEIFEYTALQVKQSVAGYGHAEKAQISKMVKYLLGLNGEPQKDAADALAVSLTHMHHIKTHAIFSMNNKKNGRLVK